MLYSISNSGEVMGRAGRERGKAAMCPEQESLQLNFNYIVSMGRSALTFEL